MLIEAGVRAEEGCLVMLKGRGATEMQLNLYGYVLKCSLDEACSSRRWAQAWC